MVNQGIIVQHTSPLYNKFPLDPATTDEKFHSALEQNIYCTVAESTKRLRMQQDNVL